MDPLKTALVLGGGGARGAYEAGVVAYLRQELEPRLGRPLTLPILSGTSVGAMNACHLAAHAEDHRGQMNRLLEAWRGLELEHELQDVDGVETKPLFEEQRGVVSNLIRGDRQAQAAHDRLLDVGFEFRGPCL